MTNTPRIKPARKPVRNRDLADYHRDHVVPLIQAVDDLLKWAYWHKMPWWKRCGLTVWFWLWRVWRRIWPKREGPELVEDKPEGGSK